MGLRDGMWIAQGDDVVIEVDGKEYTIVQVEPQEANHRVVIKVEPKE